MKKSYTFLIEETLSKRVVVIGENEEDALNSLEKAYDNEEIVLTADDHVNTEFSVISDSGDIRRCE
jgi:hypothetical protein